MPTIVVNVLEALSYVAVIIAHVLKTFKNTPRA